MPSVEEKFEKEVEPEPSEEDVPVAPKKAVREKKVVRYVPGDSDEEVVTGPGAPKSFSDRLYERGDEEFLGYPKARVLRLLLSCVSRRTSPRIVSS